MKTLWVMQLQNEEGEWVSIHQKGCDPYTYETRQEAHRMLEICYPDQCRLNRIGGDPHYEKGEHGGVRVKQL